MRTYLLFFGLFFTINLLGQIDITGAQKAIFEGNYQDAIEVLQSLESKDSTEIVQIENFLGSAYYQLGDYLEAKEAFLKAVKIDEYNVTANTQLGIIYDQESNLPKSIKHYWRLISVDTMNAQYWKWNARVQQKAGEGLAAFTFYERAHKLNPNDVTIISPLCEYFLASDSPDAAAALSLKVLKRDPSNIAMSLIHARSLYAQKMYEEAIPYFLKGNSADALQPFHKKLLGFSYMQIDSLDKAIHVLENLLEQDNKEYVYYYLATAYEKKQDWETSRFYFDKAIEKGISKNIPIYHSHLGDLASKKNNISRTIHHYTKAFEFSSDPKHLFYIARACDEYYKDKKIALRHYEKFLKYDTKKSSESKLVEYADARSKQIKEYLFQSNKSQ
jgi:tetratricopeptide (TPR) repeat protein